MSAAVVCWARHTSLLREGSAGAARLGADGREAALLLLNAQAVAIVWSRSDFLAYLASACG